MSNIKQERQVVADFIRQHSQGYFSRNIYVGRSMMPKDKMKYLTGSSGMWKVCAKQIDLIWDNEGITWLLEAKWVMDVKALGQLLVYKVLYLADNPADEEKVRLGLICRYKDPMLEQIFIAHNIEVFTV